MVWVGEVKRGGEGTEEGGSDGESGVGGNTMYPFDAPHQAAEIGGVHRRVWQAMLDVQGAYSSEVEFDGLRFEGVGEVCSKEHEGVLGCRERGAVGVELVVRECKVNEAALCRRV